MRKFITIVLFLAICTISVAEVNLNEINFPTVNARTFDQSLRRWIGTLNTDITSSGINRGTGLVFYVDSNAGGSSSSAGTTITSAVPTLDDGVNLCTANRGDVIYVMQGHAETFTAADDVDVDVAGVTIIGLGNGADIPTFSYTASGEFVLGGDGDSCVIANLRFIATTDSVVKAIDVEATCTDWAILNCIFEAETTTTDEFDDAITIAAASHRGLVAGCIFRGDSGANADPQSAINFISSHYLRIIGNSFFGDRAVACIENASPSNFITIRDNTLFNGIIGGTAGLNTVAVISVHSGTTGVIINNDIYTNTATPELSIVAADMFSAGNTYNEVEATSGPPTWFSQDSLANIIGVDDSSNLGVTTNVTADSDGSVLERLEQIDVDTSAAVLDTAEIQQTNGVRTISKSLGTIASGANNIFAVAGGAIKVTEWTIYIDTIMVATGCLIGGNVDPTVPATDTVFGTTGTALEFNGMAAGSLVMWNGVLANNFTDTTNGVALSTNTAEGMIVPVGMIELTASASNAGALTVYMSYVALGEGVTVTAQ